MAENEPILRIEGLHKSFGPLEVLKDINFEVKLREMLVIIGPSGSGKSTLLRCINRLEEPSAGKVIFNGIDLTGPGIDINLIRKDIGMVFQAFNLYPHMTAMGNVTLALRLAMKMSKSEAKERARHALDEVGLNDKIHSYPDQLSGGQQQRVGIARALALEPKIILYDEPTSALDPELVGGVLEVMKRVRSEGMTTIVVSHEMEFANEAADRVVFIDEGEIVEQGKPSEIFTSPKQRRTQEFLSRIVNR
jgi:ABC-type polar amino acid transport system ATPase subunit